MGVCATLLPVLVLACAGGALAAPGLSLQISSPSSAPRVDSLIITTTITNTGDEHLNLLNDPRSPLSDLPTDVFSIINQRGTSPDFVGIAVKYAPQVAAGNPLAFTTLAPGEAIAVQHDLSSAYNFSTSGPGAYVVKLKNLHQFYYESQGKMHALAADYCNMRAHAINVSSPLISTTMAQSRTARVLHPKPCDAWQEKAVQGAIPITKKYIASAFAELTREGSEGQHYKRWFGGPSEHRLTTVASHFEALEANNFTEFNFVCNSDFCTRQSGIFAFVYPDDFGTIHVCDQFFRSPVGGPDSRASTIVHESSHFTRNGATLDHAYGQTLTQELARSYPQLAVMNADNHEYFSATAHGDIQEDTAMLTQAYFEGRPLGF